MLMQYLPPEERKGEHKYKHGDYISYDDRPTKEQQQELVDRAKRNGLHLRKCPVCGSFIDKWNHIYCSQRCINDAYMARRRQRHEAELKKVCVVCGEKFTAKRKDALYCSNACKQAAYRKRDVTENRSFKFDKTENGNKQ